MKHIIINNAPIELEKKRIKNMYLKILPPDGRVYITAPIRMSEEEIRRFVMSKLDWIEQQQEKIKQRHTHQELNYMTGEEIYLWGQRYVLEVIPLTGHSKIRLDGDYLYLYTKEDSSLDQRKHSINTFYKKELLEHIPQLLIKWERIIGVKANGFAIRDMKTRWGTCNIRTKKITLSLQLAKKHPKCLEYVVVHELVHLLEKSHNYVFKAYLDKFLPDWRNSKKELNGMTIS